MNTMILCNRKPYIRSIGRVFYHSRRSIPQTRQLEELKQLYELLKEESACKKNFLSILIYTY